MLFRSRGHGVPEVMTALATAGGRIRPRVVLVKIAASATTIGFGGTAGREGPMIQIGSAIGSAIGIAVKRLKDLKSKSKVIILLTDGRNNSGSLSPAQSAQIGKAFGIKIYTIGVGTRGKAPFLVDSIFGKQYIYQNVEIDEKTLQEIAQTTGAEYFRATDRESLKNIYEQIDSLEKTDAKVLDRSEYRELFAYFLIPGLLFFLAENLLSHTRLRRIP